jgi:hypothetical protein
VVYKHTETFLLFTAVEKQCAYRMCLYGVLVYLVRMVSEHPMTVLPSTAAESEIPPTSALGRRGLKEVLGSLEEV